MDPLRFAALGSRDKLNRAFTQFSLCGGLQKAPSLAYLIIGICAPRARGPCTWVLQQGSRIEGLASCRPRSGVSSWEINLLCVEPDGYGRLPDLLDSLCHNAATHGGGRVFLRLAPEDPVIDAARLGGFFPALSEVLYVRHPQPGEDRERTAGDDGVETLRRKSPLDDYNLFRLYNTSTPLDVRAATGMTFDQWQSSREPLPGHHRELVADDGGVQGWVSAGRIGHAGLLAADIQPGREDLLPVMTERALRTLRGADLIFSLVPEHQVALQRTLESAAFSPVAEFVTMARSMKASVRSDVQASVTVASG